MAYCASFLLSATVQAQELQQLPKASFVQTGTFGNGNAYYLVQSSNTPGRADVALVQKGLTDTEQAKSALSRGKFTRPAEVMSRQGVGYTRSGFISAGADYRVFKFPDVPTTLEAGLDSTLLVVYDLMLLSDKEQAVVIAGDIDAGKIIRMMQALNLTIPKAEAFTVEVQQNVAAQATLKDSAVVSISLNASRPPREQMNTPVPAVSELFSKEIGFTMIDRLDESFRYASLPYSSISKNNTTYFCVPPERMNEAVKRINGAASDMREGNVTEEELQIAAQYSLPGVYDRAFERTLPNREMVNRCVNSYLFNSDLAPYKALFDFFDGRQMSFETNRKVFSNYAAAAFPKEGNYDGITFPPTPRKDIGKLFGKMSIPKVKLKTSAEEPVSGGKLWTFSNGMRVIYKKVTDDEKGMFKYTFLLRGGYAGIDGINQSEAYFIRNLLDSYDVGEMSMHDFRRALQAERISIDANVNINDFRISGSAPSDKAAELLRAVGKIASDRKFSDNEYIYHLQCRTLDNTLKSRFPSEINTEMDKILCQNYDFNLRADMTGLNPDFKQKADRYFDERFANFGDGVLVIIGDIDEYELQKALTKNLGLFPVTTRFSLRRAAQFKLPSGISTIMREGADSSINMSYSALIPVQIERYLSMEIAKYAIQAHFNRALAESGYYAVVSERFDISPEERMSLFINIRPCRSESLPEGIETKPIFNTLNTVRSLPDLRDVDLSDIAVYKNIVKSDMASVLLSSSELMKFILYRYSEGRDLVSGYEKTLRDITEENVRNIIGKLKDGCGVELIIKP